MFLGYVVAGAINCALIITILFGLQSFKLAGFALWPFGRVVVSKPNSNSVASGCGNIVWLLTGGIWLSQPCVNSSVATRLLSVVLATGVSDGKVACFSIPP